MITERRDRTEAEKTRFYVHRFSQISQCSRKDEIETEKKERRIDGRMEGEQPNAHFSAHKGFLMKCHREREREWRETVEEGRVTEQ